MSELKKRQWEYTFPLIEIEEWHNPGDCFWIMPAKVDDVNISTWKEDNLKCMDDAEISISECSFLDFLYPIFKTHFDNDLLENVGRGEEYLPKHDKDGIAFEWYLAENFYTLKDSIRGYEKWLRLVRIPAIDCFPYAALDFYGGH